MIRRLAENGFFKGKLREAYMQKSPIVITLCLMPVNDAVDILNTMDMDNRPKLLAFLNSFTEEQIATNGWASLVYALYVLKARFPMGEKAIVHNKGGLAGGGLSSDLWNRYREAFDPF